LWKNQSRNGFLPKENEFLIKTQNMVKLEFLDKNKIRVGAGPNIKHVNGVLKLFNLELPLIHGGPPGPTVGGFISAGGFGLNSNVEGGFWENVLEITLVVNNGQVLRLKQGDKMFPWVFGSMGQLGLIADAVLKVIPIKRGEEIKVPIGKIINLNSKEYYTEWKETSLDKPLYWLNFFGTNEIAIVVEKIWKN
jgi:FAD/FMN-containing dehydrogenase